MLYFFFPGQPDRKTEESKQYSNSPHGITEQELPFIIKMVEGEKAQEKTKSDNAQAPKEAPESKGWSLSDKIAAGATVAAFLQFIALVFTIQVMLSSGQRQLRAYVFPEGAALTDGAILIPPKEQFFNIPGVALVFKNSGQTPAYKMINWLGIKIAKLGDESDLIVPKLKQITPFNLGSNGQTPRAMNIGRRLSEDEVDDLRALRKGIYVYGRIEYEDAFRNKRFTNYRLVYSGHYPPEPGALFMFCQEGNEIERDKWKSGFSRIRLHRLISRFLAFAP